MRALFALLLACASAHGGEDKVAGLRFEKDALSLSGMKGTEQGPPIVATRQIGYLDHFVLDVKLAKTEGGGAQTIKLAAWFGKATQEQLKVKFADGESGKPYEIRDAQNVLVPPEKPENGKAIAFYAEASNSTPARAKLSKGIGGNPIPLLPATAGAQRLFSSMHQRFSFSLVATQEKHFREFGARYSLEQLEKLKPSVYRLCLPCTAALIDTEANRVIAARQGELALRLDLTEEKRDATLDSLKGSGSPLLPFE